jgi:hypothetical protein
VCALISVDFLFEEHYMQVQVTAYPDVLAYQLRGVSRYVPPAFVKVGALGLPLNTPTKTGRAYLAAVYSVADYILHMSVRIPEQGLEPVRWESVSGTRLAQNKAHMLSLGWKLNGAKKPTRFDGTQWYHALQWLVKAGYILQEAQGDEYFYSPHPAFVGLFAKGLLQSASQ